MKKYIVLTVSLIITGCSTLGEAYKSASMLQLDMAESYYTGLCKTLYDIEDDLEAQDCAMKYINARYAQSSNIRQNQQTGQPGTPVYSSDECVGAIVNGVCHGSIIPKSAVPVRCYGTMINGQCTGAMF